MNKLITIIFALFFVWLHFNPTLRAEEAQNKLVKLNGEILEVEELKDPIGSAVYTIKDLASGQTVKLFADPYRSVIKIGESVKAANDMMGGSKAIIIYQKNPHDTLSEIVFAKVTSSYA